MEQIYQEVYFWDYCGTCKHASLAENDSPCDECLDNLVNLYSHKPVRYEKGEEKKQWTKATAFKTVRKSETARQRYRREGL